MKRPFLLQTLLASHNELRELYSKRASLATFSRLHLLGAMHLIDPDAACPFVRQALGALRREVDGKATVLGFIGAPYTMATYCVEGGTSSSYLEIKKMGCAAAAQCCCDSDRDSVGRNSDAIPGAIFGAIF